jgi:type II secretion system protein H
VFKSPFIKGDSGGFLNSMKGNGKSITDSSGFTLLELILVMVIISTVLAMAAPSLRGFFSSRKTDDAVFQIIALTKLARAQAITEGRVYRFNMDTDESKYWLTVRDAGVFSQLNKEFGRKFLLPEGTSVQFEKENKEKDEPYIEFYPQGRTETSTIRLTDRRGDVFEIACLSPTEQFRMVETEEM